MEDPTYMQEVKKEEHQQQQQQPKTMLRGQIGGPVEEEILLGCDQVEELKSEAWVTVWLRGNRRWKKREEKQWE